MPIISQFYGIIITMYVNEEKHHLPHIHIRYNEYKEELESLWRLLQDENDYFKIEPLK